MSLLLCMAYDSMILRSFIFAGISGSGDWRVAKWLSAGRTKRKPGEMQETDSENVTGDEGHDGSMAEEGSYYGLLIVVQPKKEAYFCVFSLFFVFFLYLFCCHY